MPQSVQYRNELGKLLISLDLLGDVAEIGVAEGRFSKVILSWGVKKLYLIDAWRHLEQFGDGGYPQEWHDNNLKEVHERILGNEDKVVILQGLSSEVTDSIPNNSLSMVYIDCDHSYRGCLSDLKNYFPKVKEGGIISGHDILNPAYGVKQAVEEFVEDKYELHIIPDEEPAMASYWFQKR